MADFIALNAEQHAAVRVSEQQALSVIATQHLINLRVTELAQLACDIPVFISKTPYGEWALSGLCSVQPGRNLWVAQGQWQATYVPAYLQTYPLCALPGSERGPVSLGIFTEASQQQQGIALFDDRKQASAELLRRQKLVETDLQNEFLTYTFLQQLATLGLLQPITLVLQSAVDEQQIVGLYTINEDRLAQLSAAQLQHLQQQGMLLPIYALLLSLLQLNTLINKHNNALPHAVLKHIKLAITT
ncbi:SapC family protein [Alishewanella tabrizica]|uniref:SapC family protein n=1 Tax=Alishewanella tabrizica TaxID=671278 RepID=A0ABQ2WLI0_9ALTE|nr:SapC family protein [Alishewanella tabrizica]GGW61208.1 hypothetical protein GCM10008111_16700 [Alishewanella tabrizica]